MTDLLATHLQNHLAAARGGVDLFHRVAGSFEGSPTGEALAKLAAEVETDCEALRAVMTAADIEENKPAGLLARVGERVARLKPNGTLVRRSPLTNVVEMEALRGGVTAKLAGWDTLIEASRTDDRLPQGRFEGLRARAIEQQERLLTLHRQVAAEVFGAASS